jgi:hypothetical protein
MEEWHLIFEHTNVKLTIWEPLKIHIFISVLAWKKNL